MTLAFLEHGGRVHATWTGNETAAAALADAAARFAGRLALHRFDVADEQAVERFWAGLESEPEGVQVLLSNAGIRRDQIVGTMKSADWRAVLDVNLTGSFLMAKHAVRAMLPRKYGRIVFVTSPSGLHGFQGQANYAASKAGQIGLMRSLAREVGKRKITVNCLSPGFVDTELLADLPEEARAEHRKLVPLGRFATTEEIAHAALFLASPGASYVNGTTLEVHGGL
ncbi:MAG: SDR family oxidoreductase [Planctomycetes bacterium]|nr:SDR family oxidoreductase [Planctomycetota bacterium]